MTGETVGPVLYVLLYSRLYAMLNRYNKEQTETQT